MSRSAFAARFAELVGQTPIQYVGRWRMQLALAGLRDQRLPIADVAGRLGYRSEAAFRRAFKRHLGRAPGAARRQASST
jgi:AraC-like DNA-binding protein